MTCIRFLYFHLKTLEKLEQLSIREREENKKIAQKMVDTQSAAIISGSLSNSTKMGFFGEDELWLPWEFLNDHVGYHPWFFSMIGSVFVGLAGILPLYIIPIDEAAGLKNGGMLNTYYIINIIFLIAQYS